jgi:hypothetical protein
MDPSELIESVKRYQESNSNRDHCQFNATNKLTKQTSFSYSSLPSQIREKWCTCQQLHLLCCSLRCLRLMLKGDRTGQVGCVGRLDLMPFLPLLTSTVPLALSHVKDPCCHGSVVMPAIEELLLGHWLKQCFLRILALAHVHVILVVVRNSR